MDSIKWSNNYVFYSPLQEIVLNTPEGNIPAVPFKIGRTNPENSQVILSAIKKVYHQNIFLHNINLLLRPLLH